MAAFKAESYSIMFFIIFKLVTSATDEQLRQWETNHERAFSQYWMYTYWPHVVPNIHCPVFLQKFGILSKITESDSKSFHFVKDELSDSMIIRYTKIVGWAKEVCRVKCECSKGKYYFVKTSPSGCVALAEVITQGSEGRDWADIVDVQCLDEFKELYAGEEEPQIPWGVAFPTPIGVLSTGNEKQQQKWMHQHEMAFLAEPWEYIFWPQANAYRHCPLLTHKFGIISEISNNDLIGGYYEKDDGFIVTDNDEVYTEAGHLICTPWEEGVGYHFIKTWPPGCIARAQVIGNGPDGVDNYAKIVDVKCDDEFKELYPRK